MLPITIRGVSRAALKRSADSGLAFVVVQHLSPDYKSMMAELLSKHTAMPVRRAEDAMRVEANQVYLIPPKKNLRIFHGKLLLAEQEHNRGINLPIDIFLNSLAEDQGEKTVAVILSGTGSDGSRGIRAIKEAGGMIMVQDEDSARFDRMPKNAAATGLADFVLAPGDMPRQLLAFVKHPYAAKGDVAEALRSDDDGMTRIFARPASSCPYRAVRALRRHPPCRAPASGRGGAGAGVRGGAGARPVEGILRAVPAGIGMLQDRIFAWVNDKLTAMTGFSRDELIGRSSRVLHPSDEVFEAVGRDVYGRIAEHGSSSVETRIQRKDGSAVNVLLQATALNDDPAEGVIVSVVDLSERRELLDRRKEMDGLHEVIALLHAGAADGIAYQAIVDRLAAVLPRAECSGVRLLLGEREWTSAGYADTRWRLEQAVSWRGERLGILELVYLGDLPAHAEAPFQPAERDMLESLAHCLAAYLMLERSDSRTR